jgi:hypothetical protein
MICPPVGAMGATWRGGPGTAGTGLLMYTHSKTELLVMVALALAIAVVLVVVLGGCQVPLKSKRKA